jgi:hypothetical protein
MNTCDGTEKHSHYKLDTATLVWHTHNHTETQREFNRLHHHAPSEHEAFTDKELKITETLKVPF